MTDSIRFSVRNALLRYGAALVKTWQHDRRLTIGASEIGQCARQIAFLKQGAEPDASHYDGWGYRARGDVIEAGFWLPGILAQLPDNVGLFLAGTDQRTLVHDHLSATTDGVLIYPDGYSLNLDAKSFDPRLTLNEPKPAHVFQVHVQMGLIRLLTVYKPEYSMITYINCSDFEDIREFIIKYDPAIFEQAKIRAIQMLTIAPDKIPPEGKIAGGKECKDCAFASRCAEVTVAGIPREKKKLSDNQIKTLKALRDAERVSAYGYIKMYEEHAKDQENIKQFLRENETRGYSGEGWSVSYSPASGRASLDKDAVAAAGIDLTPYYKQGNPSERLTVK